MVLRGDASGGHIFSLAREKIWKKRVLWTRLVPTADAVQVSTNFLVVVDTHTPPTDAMVRAACYGTPGLIIVAFE